MPPAWRMASSWTAPGINDVTITGFTVQNALFEGVLVVSASDVTISDNTIQNNDTTPGLQFTGALTGCPDQPGSGIYETDETGDCGGALHLVGTVNSIVSGNLVTGNADGVLISDETAESRDHVLIGNVIKNNPLECGIVLASHPPSGKTTFPFAPHNGVDRNTVAENISSGNGVQVGGSGAGMFSDGAGQGRVSGNLIIRNP
jgi:parallel beta-helix repeat protein